MYSNDSQGSTSTNGCVVLLMGCLCVAIVRVHGHVAQEQGAESSGC